MRAFKAHPLTLRSTHTLSLEAVIQISLGQANVSMQNRKRKKERTLKALTMLFSSYVNSAPVLDQCTQNAEISRLNKSKCFHTHRRQSQNSKKLVKCQLFFFKCREALVSNHSSQPASDWSQASHIDQITVIYDATVKEEHKMQEYIKIGVSTMQEMQQ